MFTRLVHKELLTYLLDFRFLSVFALCALLSALSVYVGVQNYTRRLQEYTAVSESNRIAFQESSLDKGRLFDLIWVGYPWNRRPEALSPLVYGLSGALGQEVLLRYQKPPVFEASLFETDPIHDLFEVLDLAAIITLVLSLCVLLFTYDAVCGEKETGTLRLYASFPVARSTLALAKLAGASIAVLLPFLFACLLSAAVLALAPGVDPSAEDWKRVGALTGVFALYLLVFSAFSLWVSALTHRRMTAFLGLLGLWTVWVFIVPNLALDIARRLAPAGSVYEVRKQSIDSRWETRKQASDAIQEYFRLNPVDNWGELSDDQQRAISAAYVDILARWDAEYLDRLQDLQAGRRNRMRSQQHLAAALSALSPFGAASFLSTDLARTGIVQQERLENAASAYLISLTQYIQRKARTSTGSIFYDIDLTDFPWFTYQDRETTLECLSRNALHILNLFVLAVLGFAGAFLAILRYDVR